MKISRFRLAPFAVAFCWLSAVAAESAPPGSFDTTTPAGWSGGAAAEAPAPEPRIIRGNDRVLAAPAQPAPVEGGPSSFKLEDAPIADVVQVILHDLLKVDYVLHPPFTGTITLVTRGEVSADQAVFLLESALQANGLLMVRDARGTYHVGRPEALKGIVATPRLAGAGPLPPGYGAIVVPLQFIGAAEMATILRPMMPPEALLRVDAVRNVLVLAGTRAQAEGWLGIVSTFDVDLLKGMSVGVFPLKYVTVAEVDAALRMMTTGRPAGPATQAGAASAASGVALPGGADGQRNDYALFGAIRVMPIERLNAVLVVTPRAAYLDEARRWIERLDRPDINTAEQRLQVYQVQNGSAKHLAEVLSGIFGQADGAARPAGSTGSGVAPGLASQSASSMSGGTTAAIGSSGGAPSIASVSSGLGAPGTRTSSQGVSSLQLNRGLRIVADEFTNSLLVYGTPVEYEKIEASLRRLDMPVTQVLIEASIIEVTLNNDMRYGLQWTFQNAGGNGKTGASVLSNIAGGLLGGAEAGFSYTLRNSAGAVRAVLNSLADKSLVKVISSPSLMVLDNHTAAISVGNQQPIQSALTVTDGGVRTASIQYKDTGVALAVTPSVNAGNMVTLQINQAVTDVGEIDAATGQRTFLQRQIGSKVAVRSGESIVLGGLIRDNATSGSSGVPVLHEIPVLGALFGTKTSESSRTELLVIITPRVVRTDLDAREVSNEMRERMKSFSGASGFAAPKSEPPPAAGGPNHQ
jgi:general secretion pathway protein D